MKLKVLQKEQWEIEVDGMVFVCTADQWRQIFDLLSKRFLPTVPKADKDRTIIINPPPIQYQPPPPNRPTWPTPGWNEPYCGDMESTIEKTVRS